VSEHPRWWIIAVGGGYGSFAVFDTRVNAEKMRAAKADWEAAVVRLRPADKRKIIDKELIAMALPFLNERSYHAHDLPIVKAEELIDTTFVIRKAKAWESTLKHGGVVYFCTCASFPDGELFNTNLGGDAVVEILSKAFAAGVVAPLKVTLRKVSGGKFGRYYVLE
jgi:hypothetical protein